MRLNEVFEQAYPWRWDHQSDTSVTGNFVTRDGDTVQVELYYEDRGRKSEWTLDFAREETTDKIDKNLSSKITGQGDAFKIFTTLKEMVQDFVKTQKPERLAFTAHEPSRQRLYTYMLPKLANLVGMDYEAFQAKLDPRITNPHWEFVLTKK